MKTITVDILQDEALNLLKDLEAMNVIRLHEVDEAEHAQRINAIKSYKGLMTKQSREEIDKQLNDLRNEWD
ncbi:MAG TPA: hypothetical protein VG367_03470 [Mucilaginibacter sp.]|jgi:hypothetical protein|nr:hypothetical protein [Mucilaginibacter sp.]